MCVCVCVRAHIYFLNKAIKQPGVKNKFLTLTFYKYQTTRMSRKIITFLTNGIQALQHQ